MTALYQLRIVLSGSKPLIWRQVVIYNTTELADLHRIIQTVMGWENQHTWAFEFEQGTFGLESGQHTLQDFINESNKSFQYIYDFGDHWQHKVTVEQIIAKGQSATPPYCIAGEGACPPEDSGGIWGYAEWLDAMEDDLHPQHEKAVKQLGRNFDPYTFDVLVANQKLDQMK